MGESSRLYGIVFTLGLVSAFIVLMYTETGIAGGPPAIGPFRYPTFNDPFNQLSTITAYPTGPALTEGSPVIFGCDNTLYGLPNCVNTNDGDDTYVQFNQNPSQYLSWNWSRADLPIIDDSLVRFIQITMSCRTVDGSAFQFYMAWAWNAPTIFQNSCPVSEGYVNVIVRLDTPNGYVQNLFNSNPFAMAHMQPYWNNGTTTTARFTFLKLEIGIIGASSSAPCQAPDGAWFPAADLTACAITQFGVGLIRFLQYAWNGAVFVVAWLGVVAALIGSLVAGVVWLYAVPGMPPVIQAFVDVWLTANAVMLIYIFAKLLRGNE